MKQPKVSIITIVFNGDKTLEKAILSVINQTYKDIEYIIIDGGSIDNTLNIIKKYEKYVSKWISESDNGISDAFNKGIKLSVGEYIGFLNADDWYEKDAIENVVKFANNADVVYGNMQGWVNNRKDFMYTANHLKLRKEMSLNHPSTFVKRALFQKYGEFNTEYKIAMDYELLLKLYINKASFCYIDKVISNMSLEGISSRQWVAGYKEVRKAKETLLGKNTMHLLYYYKKLVATLVSKKMKNNPFFQYYRRNFAQIKKYKEN